MSAAQYNITIYRGEDFDETFSIVVKEGDAEPTALDMSNVVAVRSEIKAHATSATATATFECAVEQPPTLGQINWRLDAADTIDLPLKDLKYDIFIYYDNGDVDKVIFGDVSVVGNITTNAHLSGL